MKRRKSRRVEKPGHGIERGGEVFNGYNRSDREVLSG
jgi:hypothetical protein